MIAYRCHNVETEKWKTERSNEKSRTWVRWTMYDCWSKKIEASVITYVSERNKLKLLIN